MFGSPAEGARTLPKNLVLRGVRIQERLGETQREDAAVRLSDGSEAGQKCSQRVGISTEPPWSKRGIFHTGSSSEQQLCV